jgi:hypothetical protein
MTYRFFILETHSSSACGRTSPALPLHLSDESEQPSGSTRSGGWLHVSSLVIPG